MGVGKGDKEAIAAPTGKDPCHLRRGEPACSAPHWNPI